MCGQITQNILVVYAWLHYSPARRVGRDARNMDNAFQSACKH